MSTRQAQLVEPHRGGVELGEEHPIHPLRIARLQHLEGEHSLTRDVERVLDEHLAWCGRHDRTPHRAGKARHHRARLAVEPEATGERHLEVVTRARVAFDKHVVRHGARAHLRPPEVGKGRRVVVDVTDQRRLAAHNRAGGPDALEGGLRDGGAQLPWMREMRHHSQVPAVAHDALEEA